MEQPSCVLYIVATPIGNLGDLTPRAAEVLSAVDFIAAEDTRVTVKLLNHLGIKKPLVSYYRHNESESGRRILDRILAGEHCALCCDAGTPAVSDPGELLVQAAVDSGVRVIPIPGPCAAVTALSASGLINGRFCFEGFLPVNKKNRRNHLESLVGETRTMVFYEAPHKLRYTLDDLLAALGDRPAVLARELTKLHEEIRRATLGDFVAEYKTREPRGEYVLIVSGAPETESTPEEWTLDGAVAIVQIHVAAGLSLSEACKQAAAHTGIPRSDLYRAALERK